jgi:hypothetical protein
MGDGLWRITPNARVPLNISQSGAITRTGEGSVYYYYFDVPFDDEFTIKVSGFQYPAFQLFRDDGSLDTADFVTSAYSSSYYSTYVYGYNIPIAKGKYVIAVSGYSFYTSEAVSGSNYNSYYGSLWVYITGEGSKPRWRTSDPQYGWGIAGKYVDLDASTPEGPYYRIESNSENGFVIRVPDGETLDPGTLLGSEFAGVHRFDKLGVIGGASVDFGDDRVFVTDKVNSWWDLSSEIIAGEGSDLPVQQ